jgi:hypothetical protein
MTVIGALSSFRELRDRLLFEGAVFRVRVAARPAFPGRRCRVTGRP